MYRCKNVWAETRLRREILSGRNKKEGIILIPFGGGDRIIIEPLIELLCLLEKINVA